MLVFLGQFKVRLEITVGENDGDELVLIDIGDLQFLLGHVGNIGSGGSGSSIFVLLVGEDFDTDDGSLGGSVLSGLGSGVLGDLAGEALEHTVAALLDVTEGAGSAVS